jgi:hypothetical protein
MARSFHVQPEALYEFGRLVDRYGDSAEFLKDYATGDRFEFSYKTAAGNSAFSIAMALHMTMWSRAQERLQAMVDLANRSAEGVQNAARFYVATDRAETERLDRTYPETAPSLLPKRGLPVDPPAERTPAPEREFADVKEPIAEMYALQAGDMVDDMSAQALKIAEFLDLLSAANWIRKGIEALIGFDPIEEVELLFIGDWREWAEAAKGWRRIGECVDSMSTNLGRYRSLDYYWGGAAADAAIAYFYKFTTGTDREAEFFRDGLFPLYKDLMDVLFAQYTVLDNLVNGFFDAALSLFADSMRGKPTSRVKLLIELAKIIVETVLGAYRAVEAAVKTDDYDMPFSTIEEMATSTSANDPGGYQHPHGQSHTDFYLPPGYEVRPV